jgi:hypothetical protein
MKASLSRCRDAGFIDCEFPRGHKGWVELLAGEQLVARNRFVMQAQFAKGQVASEFQGVALLAESQTPPGETQKALYDSLVGEDDAARATAEPLSAGEGSSEGMEVAEPLTFPARLGLDERDPRTLSNAADEYVNSEPYRRGVARARALAGVAS